MVFDSLSELVSHLNNVTFQDDPDILGFEVTGEITGYKTRPWNDIVFINFQLQEDIGKGKFLKLACNTREDRCRFTGFEGSPKDGDKVTVKASLQYNRNISILQADVFEMRNTGKGDLLLKFQEIKERLAKEGLFDAADTWKACVRIFTRMLDKTEFRVDRIREHLDQGFLNATDVAEHLAMEGIPFREAHNIVGRMVKACEERGCQLEDLTDKELTEIDPRVNKESLGDISIRACVDARRSYGGTAPSEVRRQVGEGRKWLDSLSEK